MLETFSQSPAISTVVETAIFPLRRIELGEEVGSEKV